MKKIITGMAVLLLVITLLPYKAECRLRREMNVYKILSEKKEVKTYIAGIKDSTEKARADLPDLKKTLKEALVARMTINFKLVPRKDEADISIGCVVTEFLWTDKDPVDIITGVGPILWDVLTKSNYARMRAVFTVTDLKKNAILWKKEVKATITDKQMTEPDSVHMLNERIIKMFMWKCFSKNQ